MPGDFDEIYREWRQTHDAVERLENMGDALKSGDVERLRRDGHSLKGASANAGAVTVQEVALMIEEAGKSGDVDRAASLISEAETALQVFRQVVAEKSGSEPRA